MALLWNIATLVHLVYPWYFPRVHVNFLFGANLHVGVSTATVVQRCPSLLLIFWAVWSTSRSRSVQSLVHVRLVQNGGSNPATFQCCDGALETGRCHIHIGAVNFLHGCAYIWCQFGKANTGEEVTSSSAFALLRWEELLLKFCRLCLYLHLRYNLPCSFAVNE